MQRIIWVLSALLCSACSQTGSVPLPMPALPDMSAAPPDLRSAVDTTVPSFAGIQSVVSAGTSAITLSWAAAMDDVTPSAQITYLIYQATTVNGEMFASPSYTTSPGMTTYSVTGLQQNTRYYFVIRARDLAGNTDSNRSERSTTTDQIPDVQAPMFGGVMAAAPTGNTISLIWAAATDDRTLATELSYLIYQSKVAGGQSFTQPTYITGPGSTQHTVTGLDARTSYYFVVRAKDLSANIETNVVEKSATTGDISFSGQVQPIFDMNCRGCHSGAMPAKGLSLADAATSYLSLVNQLSVECTANVMVSPGQPDQSYLTWKLQGMGPCFMGVLMPPGGSLFGGDKNTIRGWIQAGAPNN